MPRSVTSRRSLRCGGRERLPGCPGLSKMISFKRRDRELSGEGHGRAEIRSVHTSTLPPHHPVSVRGPAPLHAKATDAETTICRISRHIETKAPRKPTNPKCQLTLGFAATCQLTAICIRCRQSRTKSTQTSHRTLPTSHFPPRVRRVRFRPRERASRRPPGSQDPGSAPRLGRRVQAPGPYLRPRCAARLPHASAPATGRRPQHGVDDRSPKADDEVSIRATAGWDCRRKNTCGRLTQEPEGRACKGRNARGAGEADPSSNGGAASTHNRSASKGRPRRTNPRLAGAVWENGLQTTSNRSFWPVLVR